VAVVICGCRNIAIRSERKAVEAAVFAAKHVPVAVRRPPERDVCLAVTREIAGHELVGRRAELERRGNTVARTLIPPLARAGTKDRKISLSVTVKIERSGTAHRFVHS